MSRKGSTEPGSNDVGLNASLERLEEYIKQIKERFITADSNSYSNLGPKKKNKNKTNTRT